MKISFKKSVALLICVLMCVGMFPIAAQADAQTLADAPVITSQPKNVSAVLNENVTFSVVASGEGLTYQWQYKTATGTTWSNSGSTGNKTATLTVGATTARNGFSFRCVIKDSGGKSVTSEAATLTVKNNTLAISKQPVSVTAEKDANVTFSVVASGEGLTYQWQYKTATGSTWSNSGSTGNKTATLTVGATTARNGFSFRCVIKDAGGKSVTSEAATLTVKDNALAISKQPVSVTAEKDANVTFSVVASGEGLTYQWQYKTATGSSWSNSGSTGSKTATLTVGATTARNGFSFRCVIKDSGGKSVTSEAATLTVKDNALAISKQPVSVTAEKDANVTFSVVASGEGLTYQWQYKTATGSSWSNSGSTGSKTATMTVGATTARNGFSFRCVIKDASGKTVTSNAATLTVKDNTLTISKQPVNAEVAAGAKVSFTVGATGTGLTYQWQVSTNKGTSWSNSTVASAKTATLSFNMSASFDGRQYRCNITDANGVKVVTDVVTLTLKAAGPVITAQPVNAEVALGAKASFTVGATGTGLTYQWQVSTNKGASWANSTVASAKTATLSFNMSASFDGRQYRCNITDANGVKVVTDVVTLTLEDAGPVITAQPVSAEVATGEKVSFTVAATGTGLTYQWQVSTNKGASWSNSTVASAKTATLSFKMSANFDSRQYRCNITDAHGKTVTSQIVELVMMTVFTQDEVVYEIIDANTLRVIGYNGSSSSVVIPETVNGRTVTEIGSGAFEGNTTMRSIDLPETITFIGERAFAGCTNLISMN